ncbi:MAG: histone deacetylase [Myxococcota bacterium]
MASTGEGVHVAIDARFLDHRTPAGHPERPERLAAVAAACDERSAELRARAPREASAGEILRIHDEAYLRTLESAAARAPAQLDPDTHVSARSHEVALLAAGAAVDVARAVARGEARAGLAAVRPPGHHAEASRAMGFCLLNNVAIAARALQRDEGLDRVLVLDWDVHHGNGTQHAFERDPSVLYVSTHQFPYYPGTGGAGEIGVEEGRGATVNVPLPAGSGDEEYTGVFERVLVPVARCYAPQAILVSCGFDAHRDDPLASMEVTRAGFLAMARIVRSLAEELCGGRIALVLEGGYAESGLREGTSAVLEALLEPARAVPDPRARALPPGSALRAAVARVADAHAATFPELRLD